MKTLKLISFTLVGLIVPAKHKAQDQTRPHIILIMTDQQRFDCVGAMGNPYIQTPHMDGLAED